MNISVVNGKLIVDGETYTVADCKSISIQGGNVYVNGAKLHQKPEAGTVEDMVVLDSVTVDSTASVVNITITGRVGDFTVINNDGHMEVNNFGNGGITNLTVNGGNFSSQHDMSVHGDFNANDVTVNHGNVTIGGDVTVIGAVTIQGGCLTVGGDLTSDGTIAERIVVTGDASLGHNSTISHVNTCSLL